MPLRQTIALGQSTAPAGVDTRARKTYVSTTSASSPADIYPSDTKEAYFPSNYENTPYVNGTSANGTHGSTPTTTFSDDTTLSTFLHQLFRSTQDAFKGRTNSNSTPFASSSGSAWSSFNPLQFATSFLPSSSTLSDPRGSMIAASAAWSNVELPSVSDLGFFFLCALWYTTSALSSNTGKSILTRFNYPVTLTFVQFAFVAGYCVCFLALRERVGGLGGRGGSAFGAVTPLSRRRNSFGTTPGWGIKKPTRHMFLGTLGMSGFQILGHVFSSMAISKVPVSTVHTIKALSPLFTVLSYAVLFRVRYGPATYIALAPLTLGVMLACSFDLRANAVGFLWALGSTVVFVSQNIFSKKLLPRESSSGTIGANASTSGPSVTPGGSSAKLDKLNLLFYSSGVAFLIMIPFWIYLDLGNILADYTASTPSAHLSPSHSSSSGPLPTDGYSLLSYFFFNGTAHFAQNLLAFSILARTSPITYSIASLIKRVAVICMAIVWSGQHVSLVQGCGMAMTFFGLWMYNKVKGEVDEGEIKRGKLEKSLETQSFLPTTAEDVRFDGQKENFALGSNGRTGSGDLKNYSMAPGNGVAIGKGGPGGSAFNNYAGGPPPHTSGGGGPPLTPHSGVPPISLHHGAGLLGSNIPSLAGGGAGAVLVGGGHR